MDKVEGLVPDENPPYPLGGWVFEATADERRTMWTSLFDAMAKLARLDVGEHFPYLTETRWGMPLDADAATERVRQWREFTVWASGGENLPPTLMKAWDTLAASTPPRPERLSINWGDAKLGNVMYRDFRVIALFDWELCGVGPAEEDFMNQIALDHVFGLLCQKPQSEGFLPRDETVHMCEELLERELIGTDWWYAFALAKMAAEIHRMELQTRKLTGKGAEADIESVNAALPALREALTAL
jgi:aminoglycoside phosphotransferase (APT) family kinase protein